MRKRILVGGVVGVCVMAAAFVGYRKWTDPDAMASRLLGRDAHVIGDMDLHDGESAVLIAQYSTEWGTGIGLVKPDRVVARLDKAAARGAKIGLLQAAKVEGHPLLIFHTWTDTDATVGYWAMADDRSAGYRWTGGSSEPEDPQVLPAVYQDASFMNIWETARQAELAWFLDLVTPCLNEHMGPSAVTRAEAASGTVLVAAGLDPVVVGVRVTLGAGTDDKQPGMALCSVTRSLNPTVKYMGVFDPAVGEDLLALDHFEIRDVAPLPGNELVVVYDRSHKDLDGAEWSNQWLTITQDVASPPPDAKALLNVVIGYTAEGDGDGGMSTEVSYNTQGGSPIVEVSQRLTWGEGDLIDQVSYPWNSNAQRFDVPDDRVELQSWPDSWQQLFGALPVGLQRPEPSEGEDFGMGLPLMGSDLTHPLDILGVLCVGTFYLRIDTWDCDLGKAWESPELGGVIPAGSRVAFYYGKKALSAVSFKEEHSAEHQVQGASCGSSVNFYRSGHIQSCDLFTGMTITSGLELKKGDIVNFSEGGQLTGVQFGSSRTFGEVTYVANTDVLIDAAGVVTADPESDAPSQDP